MATTYRKATEKDIAKGKGKSTDELSLAEATAYFNKRASETGAKKFRYKGEVYDLSGEKAAVKPAAKPSTKPAAAPAKPKARPAAPATVAPVAKGGGGADAGQMPATGVKPRRADGPSMSGKGGGGADRMPATDIAKRRSQQEMSDKAKKVAAGGAAAAAAVIGGRAVLKGAPKASRPVAKPTVSNPTYNARSGMKTGFQGKMETGVARPGLKTGGRGLAGNPAPYERIAGGGGRASMDSKDDKLPLFSKGGMVKKDKK